MNKKINLIKFVAFNTKVVTALFLDNVATVLRKFNKIKNPIIDFNELYLNSDWIMETKDGLRILIVCPHDLSDTEQISLHSLKIIMADHIKMPLQVIYDDKTNWDILDHKISNLCILFSQRLSDNAGKWINKEVEIYGSGLVILGSETSIYKSKNERRNDFCVNCPVSYIKKHKLKNCAIHKEQFHEIFHHFFYGEEIKIEFDNNIFAKVNVKKDAEIIFRIKRVPFLVSQEIGKGKVSWVNGSFLYSFLKNVVGHNIGETDPVVITNIIWLIKLLYLDNTKDPTVQHKIMNKDSVVVLTVDSESQQKYFDNKKNICTNILNGNGRYDMKFHICIKNIMDRLKPYNIPATFMIDSGELREDSKDGLGNNLIDTDMNKQVLKKIIESSHGIACHTADHYEWEKRGYSSYKHLKHQNIVKQIKSQISYVGNIKYFLQFVFCFLIYGHRITTNFHLKSILSEKLEYQPFTIEFVNNSVRTWIDQIEALGAKYCKFIRYPAFKRSQCVIDVLDRLDFRIDSSDLYSIDDAIIPVPYRLFKIDSDQIKPTNLWEIPCLWIDQYLRSKNSEYKKTCLGRFNKMLSLPGVYILLTHDKVLGGNYKHAHLYLFNPLAGFSLPMIKENFDDLMRLIISNRRVKSINACELMKLFGGIS